jgi:hypothetical protein
VQIKRVVSYIKRKEIKMKNKNLLIAVFLLLTVGLYVPVTNAQAIFPPPTPTPTYAMELTNDVIISSTEYQFDIMITRTSADIPFELNLMQIGLTYNNAVKGTGTLSVAWLAGSQNAAMVTSGQMPTLVLATNIAGYIKMAGHVASGGPGTGAQLTTTPMKVGTIRVTNTVPFVVDPLVPFNLAWSFGGSYATKISAYDPDDFKGYEITTPLTHTNTLDGPLPVELSSFLSNVNGRQVILNWETKTEVNSSKYVIERSLISQKDATLTWISIGTVQAAGTSNSPRKYSFAEKNLQAGKYQYRLKMIDNDGTFKYSSVQSAEVAVPKDFAVSQNYPNPFNPTTTIAYQVPVDAKVIMEVYNIAGQKVSELVNQDMSAGYYTANFGSSNLSSGVYIYRVVAIDKASGNNFSSIKKMMLLK